MAVLTWDWLASVPLDDWIKVTTLIYLMLQAYVLVRNEIFRRKAAK